ncbi:C45 family autoproteolytic acyltransferase/hydolase [Natronosalvus rutilus]|uniref:C45 family autoproteolytic acyltransferase/hydrolase n=1 Tax=Natronosalvus rutilus TaxID=2953753 RepID=A0A9E7SUH4_9EURY|nr:C45 family autoproteolytic acyltransferase/hydolase [Natronosalvus rutilus]UTF54774.1 C45 family autoproteolytic acyltransferase/hydrolase [Natronosalvus rutilus]
MTRSSNAATSAVETRANAERLEAAGRRRGERAKNAISQNIERFTTALERQSHDPHSLYERVRDRDELLSAESRATIRGISTATGISVDKLLAYNLYRERVFGRGCTAAIATGDAIGPDGTLFFKHSDAGISDAFEGPAYHQNQEINVVRVEDEPDSNASILIAGAGVTGMKMGVNEHGLAIGSTFSRTTTYTADDQSEDDIEVSQGSRRSEYMREALLECDSAREATAYLASRLVTEPMDTPGNILIADPTEAIVLEGEYDHIASEATRNGLLARGNTFELLDELAVSREEYASTHARYDRIVERLHEEYGSIDIDTLQRVSVDHENGPGGRSICVHPDETDTTTGVDHTDDDNSATCSSVLWHLDPSEPAESRLYIALGTPCTAWRTEAREGWICLSPTDGIDDVPESFLNGEAWLEHYRPDGPIDADVALTSLEEH